MGMRYAISEDVLTFLLYTIDTNTIKARYYPRSCSSVVKYFFTTGMVENVGYALGAIACFLTNQAIYIALADGVIKLA
jgi:hypothetical protein